MLLFQRPKNETLYAALLARNSAYEGQIWVGVTSTGIFCRLTCPAPKPKPENCRWFDSIAACVAEGFRPCKRCHPAGTPPPLVTALLANLEARPTKRWREADLIALGHDPSTVRRTFKRTFGVSFLDMARQRRLQAGMKTLASGGKVIEAQLDAGFESASAFRGAFATLLGVAPGEMRKAARLQVDVVDTPLGPMVAVADQTHLYLLEFIDRKALRRELKTLAKDAKGDIGFGTPTPIQRISQELAQYFKGHLAYFQTPLATGGTPFARSVWEALRKIPAGETRSYSDIATVIGRPSAVRAVAQANGANRLAIVIPCHRVIGADGSLTGYGGGLWRKDRLISLEHSYRRPS